MLKHISLRNIRLKESDRLRDRFPHITQTLPKPYTPGWPLWVKRYVEGIARIVLHLRWIDRAGQVKNLCAVLESQEVSSRPSQSVGRMTGARAHMNVPSDLCGNEIEGVVFVLNARRLQQPQGGALWRRVRSLIRLQRFNEGLCGCGHVVDLRLAPLPEESSLFAKDWKLRASVSPWSGETPSQVIESRPKVVEHVPNEHEQPAGRHMPIDDMRADLAPWTILLCDNLVWADCQEIRDFVAQGLQVFVCPDELHGESGYCCHG